MPSRFRNGLQNGLAVIVAVSAIALLLFTSVSVRLYRSSSIGSKEYITNRKDEGIILLDRHHRVFFTFGQSRLKTYIPLITIPEHVRMAVIAAEDKSFFHHHGFSLRGIARSVYLNTQQKQLQYGGSTISQQLIKNNLLTPDKSFLRKYQELILAIKLERTYSKSDILEMYLNSAYFGEGIFGIEEAALTYFDKHASDLTLAEASMLAGLLPAPSVLSPLSGEQDTGKARQKYTLEQMVQIGAITSEEKKQAEKELLIYNSHGKTVNTFAPHFAIMIRDELFRLYGEEQTLRSGYRIVTTLDLDWQRYSEKALQEHMATLKKQGVTNGAVVMLDPRSGEIRALVGSSDWYNNKYGKVNMALAPRQTGSAFKPIAYAAALENRTITPATMLIDAPKTFASNYRPANYDNRYHGNVLARYALANSLNVPAVEIVSRLGPASVSSTAERLGISTISPDARYNLSIALGTEEVGLLDLVGAYATFANTGRYNSPAGISEIQTKHGRIVRNHAPENKTVLNPAVSFMITSILSDPNARAATFGRSLNTSKNSAVKTGTTQSYRDAWTVGYTSDLVVGVWIGNNDNTPMNKVAGALGAAPLWRDLIEKFATQTTTPPPLPSAIIATRVCYHNGLLANSNSGSSYTEFFLSGTQPTQICAPPKPVETPQTEEEKDDEKEEKDKKEDDKKKDSPKKKEEDEAEEDEQQTASLALPRTALSN